MSSRLQVVVYENRQACRSEEFDGPVELGRQRDRDETLYARRQEGGVSRWVIARRDETMVGRGQMTLTPLPDGRVRVFNGSERQPIRFYEQPDLAPGADCELALPVILVLSSTKTVRVLRASPLLSLTQATLPPRASADRPSRLPTLAGPGETLRRSDVLQWLSQAGELLQASAGGPEYFGIAARVTAETVDLEAVRVLMLQGEEWQPRAVAGNGRTDAAAPEPPSTRVLESVAGRKRTFWEMPGADGVSTESLSGIEAVVAAPILDKGGEVIGALYGERRRSARPARHPLGEVEASLVELIARIVAGGLARVEEEQRANVAQAMFEQAFGPALARRLSEDPGMLEGRDRDVTILFCDIRGFSRISGKLGAAKTIEWCRDVLDRLSGCVMGEGGVVVDYVGDGLMAMWGAPGDQPDHAGRACRAALAILDGMPELNAKWKPHLGEEFVVGMGINSGEAQVGNVGSQHKLKYGAMGNTVNVASRVQGATKLFRCPILMTGETRALLGGELPTRRLGEVRARNIARPVALHQLFPRGWARAEEARREYEEALEQFERHEFGVAARRVGDWQGRCQEDEPAVVLLYRALRALIEGVPPEHPVWELKEA